MTVKDILGTAGFKAVNREGLDNEWTAGYTSDLLSDVMANAKEGSVLITIQAHKNTVAVAALSGIRAVVVCNSRSVPQDMIEAADREKIAILVTAQNQFETSAGIRDLLKAARNP